MTSPARRCTQCPPVSCSSLNGCSINDLGDVDTAVNPPMPGTILIWNGTNYVPGPRFSCDFLSACSIDSLSDVDTATTPPAPGQVPVWNGTHWVPGPAGSFDCAQLATCSIDALVDVDISTTPPAPGQVLAWNGTQLVPVTIAGATPPATDCGLLGDGTPAAPLEVATSAVWGDGSLPYTCPDTSGAAIYCDTAGQIRTAPERFFDTSRIQVVSTSTPTVVTDIVAPGAGLTDLDRMSTTFTNPSPCLPFKGVIEVSLDHCEFVFESGDYINVTLYSQLLVSGAVTDEIRTHQHWWFRAVDTVTPLVDTTATLKKLITIPPGGTVTLDLGGQITLANYEGAAPSLLVNTMVFGATLWGGN